MKENLTPTIHQWIDKETGMMITKAILTRCGSTLEATTRQRDVDEANEETGKVIATAKVLRKYYTIEEKMLRDEYSCLNYVIGDLITEVSRTKEKLEKFGKNTFFDVWNPKYRELSDNVRYLTEALVSAKAYRMELAQKIVDVCDEIEAQTNIIISVAR